MSAIQRTDLQKELDDLREDEAKAVKRSNIFKISHTKKKIDSMELA
jgi:hypothetical protein